MQSAESALFSNFVEHFCFTLGARELIFVVKVYKLSLCLWKYTAKNNWARFDTDCRKVSNRGRGGARIEHVRPLRPRTDTGVTCRFEL